MTHHESRDLTHPTQACCTKKKNAHGASQGRFVNSNGGLAARDGRLLDHVSPGGTLSFTAGKNATTQQNG
jgi:hypothetical protein